MGVIKLACAGDETKALATGEVKAVLDEDREVESLIVEVFGKNNRGV
jgi:hypothetical protein